MMRYLGAAAFILLALNDICSARILEFGDFNVTGTGAFCRNAQDYPAISINTSLPLEDWRNCHDESVQISGAIISNTTEYIKIGVHASLGCQEDNAPIGNDFRTISFVPGTQRFDIRDENDDLLNALNTQISALNPHPTCDKTVCVGLYVEKAFEWVLLSKQEFVSRQCIEDMQKPVVDVTVEWQTDYHGGENVGTVLFNGKPAITISDIFDRISLSVREATLPVLDTSKLNSPRGVIVYLTKRHIDDCDYHAAHLSIEDELIFFGEVYDEIAEGQTKYIPSANAMATFGENDDEMCPFCGEGTVVVLFDWMAQGKPRTDCLGFQKRRIFIECDQGDPASIRRHDVIPNYIDQGLTAWVRMCDGLNRTKLFRMEQGFSDKMLVPRDYRYLHYTEVKGVARMKAVAEVYTGNKFHEKTLLCTNYNIFDEAVKDITDFTDQLSQECKDWVENIFRGDVDVTKAEVVAKCGNHSMTTFAFEMRSRIDNVMAALKNGICPDGGFDVDSMPNDFAYGTAPERSKTQYGTSQKIGIIQPMMCDDEASDIMCGYRMVAELMRSPYRLQTLFDFQEILESMYESEEDRIHELAGVFEGNYDHANRFRGCARPPMFAPIEGTIPAFWKTDDEGTYRGYRNIINGKICYKQIAKFKCPACAEQKRKEMLNGSGSGSGTWYGSGSGSGAGKY